MSCCGGNCGCGDSCKCGSGCKGCHSIPDLSFGEKTVDAPLFAATASDNGYFDDSVTVAGENGCGCAAGGCKCGDTCTCDPCNCK
uniref:Metallothionein-like protein n=1 Tax=Picea sitchensis TaxID=3332 RepID=A9NTC1_PICSI|nr:unknown [Picea sitchensis]ACN41150.1 unknown [Picea sitchensis]